jgi:hypothetical protein
MFGGKFIHDNTGLGDVIDDFLKVDPIERRTNTVVGLNMVGAQRAALFNEYIAAIENHNIFYPKIDMAYNEHKYVTQKDLFGAGGHPPDSFAAGALAWSLHPPFSRRKLDEGLMLPVSVGSRGSSPWSINY